MSSLKEAREKRGIKQKAVAEYCGIARQTYARYEDDSDNMPIHLAKRACEFIGCDAGEIFFAKTM